MNRSAATLLASLVALACYSTYTVISFGPRDHVPTAAAVAELERDLRETLSVSCMDFVREDRSLVWSTRRSCADAVSSLEGARSQVSIAINPSDLTVTIRDFDNTTRTAFVAHLEAELSAIFLCNGGHHLKFERQAEFMVPNS